MSGHPLMVQPGLNQFLIRRLYRVQRQVPQSPVDFIEEMVKDI
jgi:hypothetical protein